ncbi:MAG: hypothetical protein KKD44_25275 [Proteobacteria bacterium]|nr:hypothetical protein [Pseudomonadota bacterium]
MLKKILILTTLYFIISSSSYGADLMMKGALSWSRNRTTAKIWVERIVNNENNTTSANISLQLWVSSREYSGGALSGKMMGEYKFSDPLQSNYYYYDIEKTVDLSLPPNGSYHVSLILLELLGSHYEIRDYVNFKDLFVLGDNEDFYLKGAWRCISDASGPGAIVSSALYFDKKGNVRLCDWGGNIRGNFNGKVNDRGPSFFLNDYPSIEYTIDLYNDNVIVLKTEFGSEGYLFKESWAEATAGCNDACFDIQDDFGEEEHLDYRYTFEINEIRNAFLSRCQLPSVNNETIAWSSGSNVYMWNNDEILQITNNDQEDICNGVSLYNRTIAWFGHDHDDDSENMYSLYYWDGNSIIRIKENIRIEDACNDSGLSLYDKSIVWSEKGDINSRGFVNIYLWDGVAINEIPHIDTYSTFPELSGDIVTWSGNNGHIGYQVYFWDGFTTTKLTSANTTGFNPSIDDGNIAWVGNSTLGVCFWNGERIKNFGSQYPAVYSTNKSVSVDKGSVVWVSGNNIIYNNVPVTNYGSSVPTAHSPDVHNDMIVWLETENENTKLKYATVTKITVVNEENPGQASNDSSYVESEYVSDKGCFVGVASN